MANISAHKMKIKGEIGSSCVQPRLTLKNVEINFEE
jgi:hypothetical protein